MGIKKLHIRSLLKTLHETIPLARKNKNYPEFENTKDDKLHPDNLLDSVTVLGQVGQLTELQLINLNSQTRMATYISSKHKKSWNGQMDNGNGNHFKNLRKSPNLEKTRLMSFEE